MATDLNAGQYIGRRGRFGGLLWRAEYNEADLGWEGLRYGDHLVAEAYPLRPGRDDETYQWVVWLGAEPGYSSGGLADDLGAARAAIWSTLERMPGEWAERLDHMPVNG